MSAAIQPRVSEATISSICATSVEQAGSRCGTGRTKLWNGPDHAVERAGTNGVLAVL